MRMRNRFPRFFLARVVVQNVSLRMTDRATRSDATPKVAQQPRTYLQTTNFCVIIEDANKMAGKGQITSERARKR
jgi:hypothetical protein